jgi:hypothetical protein
MKKVKHCTLDWRYLDAFYKVSNQVEMKSDYGYKIDIKQEEELTKKQKDYFLEICQEAIEVYSEKIIEFINDKIYDYVIDNEHEIFIDLEDLEVITNENYLKD